MFLIRIEDPQINMTNQQMYSYLKRLSSQLNYALNNISEESFTPETIQKFSSDTKKDIDASLATQYSELKSLIIKTADIIRLEMDVLETTLHKDFVAQSEFGEYKLEAENKIQANAENITLNYNRVEDLTANLDKVETSFENYKTEQKSYIKFGYIYDEEIDGVMVPVTGIAVGEDLTTVTVDGEEVYNVENRLATFASNKLAFWQNGSIIAYFSGQRLVVSTIQMGDWLITSDNGLAFKYIGEG